MALPVLYRHHMSRNADNMIEEASVPQQCLIQCSKADLYVILMCAIELLSFQPFRCIIAAPL
eukprot:scaffold234352_cov39-Prasinocladus_malaysianus.AAC.1